VSIREQVTIRAWIECVGCTRTIERFTTLPVESLTTGRTTQTAPYFAAKQRDELRSALEQRHWAAEGDKYRCAHCVAVLVDPLGGAP
jgi:hypothetical protein